MTAVRGPIRALRAGPGETGTGTGRDLDAPCTCRVLYDIRVRWVGFCSRLSDQDRKEEGKMTSILIVDDEPAHLDNVQRILRMRGYSDVTGVSDAREVPSMLGDRTFDIALLDITMPFMNGLDLLRVIKETSPQTECIMLTASESIPTVIKAVKLGAYDYIMKPYTPDQLIQSLDRALERKRLIESLRLRSADSVSRSLNNPRAFRNIVTSCQNMLRLLHEAELHASSRIPVLITGETGVGKELLARAIHDASDRSNGPFTAVNMLSISSGLFESEFFGHTRGAFTGAERDKTGYLAMAQSGSLFLDEIGDLPIEVQGKLLRILQEGEYTPVGTTKSKKVDVRFIAATNQDLRKRVEDGLFRKDLFYRLQFAHLNIPPLRERLQDIPLLAAIILENTGKKGVSLSQRAEEELLRHEWPGNVRELMGVLEAAANLAVKGEILPEHIRIPEPVRNGRTSTRNGNVGPSLGPLAQVVRKHTLAVYEAMGRNKTRTAMVLGIGLQTLHRKLNAYSEKNSKPKGGRS